MPILQAFNPTHFPNGISNTSLEGTLQKYSGLDPVRYYQFFNDFSQFDPNEWTIIINDTGGTLGNVELLPEDKGVLGLTTSNGVGSSITFLVDAVRNTVTFTIGKKVFYGVRLKLNDVLNTELASGFDFGVSATAIQFVKAVSENSLNILVSRVGNIQNLPLDFQMQDNEYVDAAFYYDGGDLLKVFINNNFAITVPLETNTSYFDRTAILLNTIATNNVATNTLSLDYIFFAQER